MTSYGTRIEGAYRQLPGDPEFGDVFQFCFNGVSLDDDALADFIEAEGRWRLRKGRTVVLERYLCAIHDAHSRPNSLDAALEVALRSMSGSSRISQHAAEQLASKFPEFREAIHEARTLNAALWSTSGLRDRLEPPPSRCLPCDFGPRTPSGEPRYTLLELIGQGSFGQVYRAADRQLSEKNHAAIVAIKILAPSMQMERERHRMIEEATKSRRISHPNVVQVLDRGISQDGEDFIVYEFVGGGDLATRCATDPRITTLEAVHLIAQIARGVHAAHAAGVIHCDLKPGNIMLTVDGQPKVADFGIAVRIGEHQFASSASRSVRHEQPVGNIAFISPEQYRSEDRGFSAHSDVYALGGILYFLLVGELPNGSTRDEIARAHDVIKGRSAAPSPKAEQPRIEDDLDAICSRALAPRPEDRHESAAALAEDLERWAAREPIAWRKPSLARRLSLWSRRKPALAASTLLIGLVALGGAMAAGYYAREADQNATQAKLSAAEAERTSLEARLAQAQVDRDAALEAQRKQWLAAVSAAMLNLKSDQRFLTDMLMQVWVFEFVYGPKALGDPIAAQQMWGTRVEAVRSMLDEQDRLGNGDTLESSLWRHALAFWLISARRHDEGLAALDRVQDGLERMLDPNDPWLVDLAALRACALVSEAHSQSTPPRTADGRARLTELQATLEQEAHRLAITRPRSPLHYLVLNRLADLHEPGLLNVPEKASALRHEIADLLDATQRRNTESRTLETRGASR